MFVDAYTDKKYNLIRVVERINGERVMQNYPTPYEFYYQSKDGMYRSIYGEACEKYVARSPKSFYASLKKCKEDGKTFESDIKPVLKVLEQHYKNAEAPKLNKSFFDIETDFDDDKGFAPPEDPFNEITAISIYNNWEDICYTLAVAPATIDEETANKIASKFPNTLICPDEKTLLLCILEIIKDADVLSGWNSEAFDVPYIVGRIYRVLGADYAAKMCLWDVQPKKKSYLMYGKESVTYQLVGRIHLDYYQLYKKFTYRELPSYSLDFVGKVEVNEQKVAYKGSLDNLYKYDFETFLDYSRQDTMLLVKLDEKLKFIDLANAMAHENCVTLDTTLGTVALTDNAITIEAHERGFVVPDREEAEMEDTTVLDKYAFEMIEKRMAANHTQDEISEKISSVLTKIAGGYVANPKKGITKWIGSIDVTSLYPSVIMALNISPETIIAQVDMTDTRKTILKDFMKAATTTFADAWGNRFSTLEVEEIFNKTQKDVTIHFDYAGKIIDSQTVSAQQAKHFIYDSGKNYNMSANGTIFTHEVDGIIPGLILKWFTSRKSLQKKAGDVKKEMAKASSKELKEQFQFWDQRQLSKKIQLNALYGALTNPASRFYDVRMGQSITLTGRSIVRHMAYTVHEYFTGERNYEGSTVIYGDTDSVYYSASPIKDKLIEQGFIFNEENVKTLYDAAATHVNSTFKKFMMDTFNCREDRAEKIKADREICGRAGLFIKKKRYAIDVYDVDGMPVEGGSYLKIMGIETQRSDTPEFIQDFLKLLIKQVLSSTSNDDILTFISDFRKSFRKMNAWELGTPKRCNNLTNYSKAADKNSKAFMPGHVRAAYNWNKLRKVHEDNRTMPISDGAKTIVCMLKQNVYRLKSIGYPIDEANLPEWFTSLPFDTEGMEEVLIDKKLENIIGDLGYDITTTKQSDLFNELFT